MRVESIVRNNQRPLRYQRKKNNNCLRNNNFESLECELKFLVTTLLIKQQLQQQEGRIFHPIWANENQMLGLFSQTKQKVHISLCTVWLISLLWVTKVHISSFIIWLIISLLCIILNIMCLSINSFKWWDGQYIIFDPIDKSTFICTTSSWQ